MDNFPSEFKGALAEEWPRHKRVVQVRPYCALRDAKLTHEAVANKVYVCTDWDISTKVVSQWRCEDVTDASSLMKIQAEYLRHVLSAKAVFSIGDCSPLIVFKLLSFVSLQRKFVPSSAARRVRGPLDAIMVKCVVNDEEEQGMCGGFPRTLDVQPALGQDE